MKTFNEMQYNPIAEKLVEVLCNKTQNTNPLFFRVLVGYYFSLLASSMRTVIVTHDRGEIPVNMYAMNLSTSGTGKGFSTNIIEGEVIHKFRANFMENTFPELANRNLPVIAERRSLRNGTELEEELTLATKEFARLGELAFSFDSGTPAAVKQMRHKLLMANAGSVNLIIDEIGSNLVGNVDVLNTFLELYDVGLIKQKLTKNTAENLRGEEIVGRTPTNMLLFGTPSKLLDGGDTEDRLYSMLDTGYARRCFFGLGKASRDSAVLTPEQVYTALTTSGDSSYLKQLSSTLERRADLINVNRKLTMSKETSVLLIEYRMLCEELAEKLPEHADIKKAELSHRYFKALKLAGAYAFIDDSFELTSDHLYQAIKLAEASGESLNGLLTRERNYMKLARYIATVGRELTQPDLVEDLPYYRGSTGTKAEMLGLAIAFGYKNNIIIKKSFEDGVEFLRGESLKPTDLNKVNISYSSDITSGYKAETPAFAVLHKLTQAEGMHWVTHTLKEGYRNEANCVPGFNLIVIDVDGDMNLSTAQLLLKDYTYLIHTTKRHTEEEHRFRIIMPISHTLSLDAKDFKEFMTSIYKWLPFGCDAQTNQRSRKWLTHPGDYWYNDGALIDVLPFIPKTKKSEERVKLLDTQTSMDGLERWFINNTGGGNRNNQLLKYAYVLVDAGYNFDGIRSRVLELNDKLPDKLKEAEIMGTILVSVSKALSSRQVP